MSQCGKGCDCGKYIELSELTKNLMDVTSSEPKKPYIFMKGKNITLLGNHKYRKRMIAKYFNIKK